jgi:hypothetical protein
MESLFRERNLGLVLAILKQRKIAKIGYIARPTDQRLKFGLLFQDYMPNIPNIFKFSLQYRLLGGSPSYADPYLQNRLNDYRRVVFKVLLDHAVGKANWLGNFKELAIGCFQSI